MNSTRTDCPSGDGGESVRSIARLACVDFPNSMHELSSNVAIFWSSTCSPSAFILEQHIHFFIIFPAWFIEFIIFLRGADEPGVEHLFGADLMHCRLYLYS